MAKQDAAKLHILSELQNSISASLFEDLVENFPDIIHSVSREGRIVSTNRKAEQLLGYTRDELIGMHIFDLYAEEVQKLLKQGFENLKKKGFSDAIESKLKSKTGEIIDVEIRSLSLYDSDNNFDRTFSIIRDIREKKKLQAQLYQQSKLAGIGELAAGIVHDIRNPLSIIKGLNRTSLKRAIEERDLEKTSEIREKIDKASERINRLCSHLRDYMRQEHEVSEPTKLKSLIEDSLLICENRISQSKVKIVNEVTDDQLEAVIPANSVEQVIINILSNACDAVANCEVREVRVRCKLTDSQICFEIEDTGPGIPENVKTRIFESFFTTKPKGLGTGLGLSICRGIVEEHNGSLALDDSYNEGARFVICFPLPQNSDGDEPE